MFCFFAGVASKRYRIMYGDIGGCHEKVVKMDWYRNVEVDMHSQITRIMKKFKENIYIQ